MSAYFRWKMLAWNWLTCQSIAFHAEAATVTEENNVSVVLVEEDTVVEPNNVSVVGAEEDKNARLINGLTETI